MAQWFRFARNFDYPVKRGVDQAFKAGTIVLLNRAQLAAAEAAKVGQRTSKPGAEISVEPTPRSDVSKVKL